MNDRRDDIDALLNSFLEKTTLNDLFAKRIAELDISPNAAFKIIGVQPRTIKGILAGKLKIVDFTSIIKLADFLQITKEEAMSMYMAQVEQNFPSNDVSPQEKIFIQENFDLTILKKSGVINSISDYVHIKERILTRLALSSIFQYRKPKVDVAFSSGLYKTENDRTRAFWVNAALVTLKEINNPNEYDREALIKIFPKIRWYSTNVDKGLTEVAKLLYTIGITIIFQPSMPTLQLRGATFCCNNRPCIVLTDYVGFYPTLWFALIHELYHVLFDWEEIRINRYHLTDDSNEQLSVRERERRADHFAREFLFSGEKLQKVKPYINDETYIAQVAANNQVHPSIIYTFIAYDSSSKDRYAWKRARALSPTVDECEKPLPVLWTDPSPIHETVESRREVTYN